MELGRTLDTHKTYSDWVQFFHNTCNILKTFLLLIYFLKNYYFYICRLWNYCILLLLLVFCQSTDWKKVSLLPVHSKFKLSSPNGHFTAVNFLRECSYQFTIWLVKFFFWRGTLIGCSLILYIYILQRFPNKENNWFES